MKHVKKIYKEYFQEVISLNKKAEIRRGDYSVSDLLVLKEISKESGRYTGRVCSCIITHICEYGQTDGFKVLSISNVVGGEID